MDDYLTSWGSPKLYQEEINSLNRIITYEEIETVIWNLPSMKSPGPNGFTPEFYQTFKDDLQPILLNLFKRIETEGNFPNSFYEAIITLIPKPVKDKPKKKTINPYL